MNKQHTFCFKIADVSIELLHEFLERASKNHLFVDLPDILMDGRNGSLEYNSPELYVNGDVEFSCSDRSRLIGIEEHGFVVTYGDIKFFGKDTVFIPHPTHSMVNYNLRKSALKKQEQKMTEAPNNDGIVQMFQTADGSSFKTRAEAEYHRDRERLIEKLADDTDMTNKDAERALNWLEANHPRLKED